MLYSVCLLFFFVVVVVVFFFNKENGAVLEGIRNESKLKTI